MRRRKLVVLWGLACGFGLLSAMPASWARDDAQWWNSWEVSKSFGPSWQVFFLPQIRLRDDLSQLFYHEYRQGIRWKPSTHLQLGVNYLFARNASSGKPLEEHTGEFDVTPKTTLGPVETSLRWRLALRTIQRSSGEQEWQMRVMPRLAYPLKVAGWTLTPYVADDLFYDYTRAAWNQQRIVLGAVVPLKAWSRAKVSLDVYYMLQSALGKRHDWSSNHILGTTLSLQF